MDNVKYSEMSNAELKLSIEKSYNEFISLKAQMLELAKKMEKAQSEYDKANNELNNRKDILL
jgi:hypothetical protein